MVIVSKETSLSSSSVQLSPSEKALLEGNHDFSKTKIRYLRYRINKKLRLQGQDYLASIGTPLVYANSHRDGAATPQQQQQQQQLPRQGSPSLVGRGIAAVYNDKNKDNEKGAGSGNFASTAPFSAFPSRHFEPTCPFGHGISNPTPYCPSLCS
jgi:hypothetical protein